MSSLMIHESLWREAPVPRFPRVKLPKHVDVAIVGAGITGLTAAWLLKKAGKRVAVFDREHVASGESASTSAHLTHVTDMRLHDLVDKFGRDGAALAWHGGAFAIDLIERHVTECRIRCQFRRVPGFIHASLSGKSDESPSLQAESDLARDLGFAATFLARGPLLSLPAVMYRDQARMHPVEYLAGLARAIDGDGSMIFDAHEVGGVIDDPLAVIVNGENVTCDRVVIATHVPLAGKANMVGAMLLQTKLHPYSSYVLGARVERGAIMPGLYWDTTDPYYYLRVHENGDQLYAIFGGEDHKTGQADDTEAHFSALDEMFRRVLPGAVVERRWSGQVIETSDGLPFIGETTEKQFIATGYAGNGLTFGTLAGYMAHDAVLGNENPWMDLFDPARKKLSSVLTTAIAENAHYPWHYVVDRLRQDRKGGPENVAPGEGKVIVVDGQRVACHRTEGGELIMLKAECTHMGCLVRWNQAERTWDCPCHGSRFTTEGLVVGGPAESPLERIAR